MLFHFSFRRSPRPCPRLETAPQHTAALCTQPLPSSSSGLVWGDEDLPVTPKPATHTFLHISICTLTHINQSGKQTYFYLCTQTHTSRARKHRQIGRQSTHMQTTCRKKCLIPLIWKNLQRQTGTTQQLLSTHQFVFRKIYVKHTYRQFNTHTQMYENHFWTYSQWNRVTQRTTLLYSRCTVGRSVCAHKHTPVVSGQHTQNFSLVFELSVPLKVSAACEEDLTVRENTHTHTHTAMSTLLEQKNWLSWISPCSPFLFSICLSVGEPVWGKIMPTIHMRCFTFSAFTVRLLCTYTANPLCQSLVFLCFLFTDFFQCSLSVFCLHSFSPLRQLQPYLFPIPHNCHLSSSLHPFVISVVLCGWPTARERQVQECRPNFPASPPKLHGTVPITMWPTKAFPGLVLVTRAPLCCGYRGCH